MTKEDLETKTNNVINETRDALQTMYDALNRGQQKQIIKDQNVKALFDRYGITYSG